MNILFDSLRPVKSTVRNFGGFLADVRRHATRDEIIRHREDSTYSVEEKRAADHFGITLTEARELIAEGREAVREAEFARMKAREEAAADAEENAMLAAMAEAYDRDHADDPPAAFVAAIREQLGRPIGPDRPVSLEEYVRHFDAIVEPSHGFADELIIAIGSGRIEATADHHDDDDTLIIEGASPVEETKPTPTQARTMADRDAERSLLGGLHAHFMEAAKSLKYPRIRCRTADGRPIVVALGREKRLNVTNGEPYGTPGSYHGYVNVSGRTTILDAVVLDAVKRLATDPAGVAAEYGKATGECSLCGRPLSNSKDGSAEIGYGKTCAQKFNLPWKSNENWALAKGQKVTAIH